LNDVRPIPNTRRSPSGLPLDFSATSAWHAACYLLVSYVFARVNKQAFSSDEHLFDTFFGNCPVYRGQPRPWNIIPTAWRTTDSAMELRRRGFRDLIASFMGPEDAIEFELFGRVRTDREGDAIAQHYGLLTNLVDFTFDPRIALHFACSETAAPRPESVDSSVADCGVVYFISFLNLCTVGNPTLTFRPVQAQRIFRQSGFFVDYGARPAKLPAVLDFKERWMWLQQNCGRIFFPRRYPEALEAHDIHSLSEGVLVPDPFLVESVERIERLSLK